MNSDIHGLSGAFALDAVDDVERAQFARHLAACAECRAEVQSFTETAAHLAEIESQEPPAGLRARVLADIGTVRPFPPETTAPVPAPAGASVVSLRRRALPALVAAVVALILAAGGAAVWHPWTGNQTNQTNLADQIINAPDAIKITEPVPGGGKLTIVRSASLKRAVMIGDHVPEPQAGTTYQLWLQQPGQGMVSAGLMTDSTEPTVLAGDAATATAAAITVEPETGSAHPTSDPIAVFPLRSTT
ncbi:anti-sigma factor [Nocardioides cynanchi]|uniref:anti-sigma factor n=1 Tax=Nocardioides cynanchi TaxID=2558918 RepID=UPI0012469473|nr:anti-sigma factor [Nocardioides cynanchi]